MLQHGGTDQYHDSVSHESGTGVHEHTDNDRYHRIGQDVYMDERIAHEECCQQHENHDQRVEHRDTARLLKIVLSVKGQIKGKAYHEYSDIEYLS